VRRTAPTDRTVAKTFAVARRAGEDVETAWNDALREEFPGSSACVGASFEQASFRTAPFAGGLVTDISSGAQRVTHEPSRGWGRTVSVVLQVSGEARLVHRGVAAPLAPGALVLLDTDHRLSLEFRGPYRQVFALVPAARLGALGALAFGRPTGPSSPVDQLLFDNVLGLATAAPAMDARRQALAQEALVSLIRLSSPASEAGLSGRRIEKAMVFIDEHLGDPELSARVVANAQGISRRGLDHAFRAAGTTTERMIWERRLQRAAALLETASKRPSVLEVAIAVGFRSPSHFSRAYRERFGHSPSHGARPE
jgi:AraC-like DNA-binding protein